MAVSFLGSACSQKIMGDRQDYAGLAIIYNEPQSTHTVRIRRITAQMDMQVAVSGSTTLFVPVLVYRGTGTPDLTGGCKAPKAPFDTAQTSDPYVNFYYAVTPDGANDAGMSGTPGVAQWRKWAGKLRSAAEQQLSEDQSMLPALVKSYDWVLAPGQYLLVRADPVVVTDNNEGLAWVCMAAWEEEPVETFTISGNVTLSGAGVVGAEVTVLVADDESLTNAFLHSIQTTGAAGAWSATIPVGKLAYAYATNFSSGTYYTAEGRPFIS